MGVALASRPVRLSPLLHYVMETLALNLNRLRPSVLMAMTFRLRLYNGGGQRAAREPHAVLFGSKCGSRLSSKRAPFPSCVSKTKKVLEFLKQACCFKSILLHNVHRAGLPFDRQMCAVNLFSLLFKKEF